MQRRKMIPAIAAATAAIAAGNAAAGEAKTAPAALSSPFGDPSGLYPENPAIRRILSRLAEAASGKAGTLSTREKKIAVLAAWAGTGCAEALEEKAGDIVGSDFTADELRELVYQSTAYLGAGRTARLFAAMNRGFRKAGISAADASKALEGDRRTEGNRLQIEGYGPQMERRWEKVPADIAPVHEFLAENCFGDYYARPSTLNWQEREGYTFLMLAAFAAAPAQAKAHAVGSIRCGISREKLLASLWVMLPWIGYPSTLNAVSAVNDATKPAK